MTAARDMFPVLAEASIDSRLLCWTEAAAALDEVDRLRAELVRERERRIEAQRRHARAVNHPAAVLATGTLAERQALAAQIVAEPSPLRVDTDTCDPAGIVRPNVVDLADRRPA